MPRLKYWMPIHYETIEDGQNKKFHLLFSFLDRIVLFLHFIVGIYLSKISLHLFIGFIWIIIPLTKINVSIQGTKIISCHVRHARKFRLRTDALREMRCSRALNTQLPRVIAERAIHHGIVMDGRILARSNEMSCWYAKPRPLTKNWRSLITSHPQLHFMILRSIPRAHQWASSGQADVATSGGPLEVKNCCVQLEYLKSWSQLQLRLLILLQNSYCAKFAEERVK